MAVIRRRAWTALLVLLPILLSACSALPAGLGAAGPQDYSTLSTFYVVTGIGAVLFALVIGILIYSMVRFRSRPGAPEPEQVAGNTRLEIGWTTLAAVLIGIAFVFSVTSMITLAQPAPTPLTLVVIGHQWWWEYEYPTLNVRTANELHVPTNTPLRVEVESADVLHSFWLPTFGRMIDAIPGRTNYLNVTVTQPGVLAGTCNQFCGAEHAWMRITGVAESKADFDAWVAQQQQVPPEPTAPELQRGKELVLSNTCVACHNIAGTAAQGRVGPDLSHIGGRQTLATGIEPNTPEWLARWITDPGAIKPGVRMPAYENLPPEDIAAMVAYLESLK